MWSLALPTLNLLEPEKLHDKVPAIVPSLESFPKIFSKLTGSKAKYWLFFFSYSCLELIGVEGFTVI